MGTSSESRSPLTDEQKRHWQQALKGLQEANECSLEEFSEFTVKVREIIAENGIPVVRAIGWALPALRIPRDSYYFDAIPESALGHANRWKKLFTDAYNKELVIYISNIRIVKSLRTVRSRHLTKK